MGGYTRAVSGQRLGKHVPLAIQQSLNNATVGLQQWEKCFLRGSCREVISEAKLESIHSVNKLFITYLYILLFMYVHTDNGLNDRL
jgi:hypothetical protein